MRITARMYIGTPAGRLGLAAGGGAAPPHGPWPWLGSGPRHIRAKRLGHPSLKRLVYNHNVMWIRRLEYRFTAIELFLLFLPFDRSMSQFVAVQMPPHYDVSCSR